MPQLRSNVVLVGNPGPEHVGAHLMNVACEAGVEMRLCNSADAYRAWAPLTKFNWWLRGHRPARLGAFSAEVGEACAETGAGVLLSTGIAPIDHGTLESLGRQGIVRMNFLTDDPWNPAHRAPWFFESLPHYDFVFSPRRANLGDLRAAGCRNVEYLPFGYAQAIHFPDPPSTPAEKEKYAADVVFAGGADAERIPYMLALIEAGFRVALYGGYWNKYPGTRASALGHASGAEVRKAVGGARIALCLVRRANRDGHAMRSLELAAMGGCILAEDTAEHREILGPPGECALYFGSIPEMVAMARTMRSDEALCRRLSAAVRQRIVAGGNSYLDRLRTMLQAAERSGAKGAATGTEDFPGYAVPA